jgi:ketosteroid isomerase-like protein
METEQAAKILRQWFESWAKDDIETVIDGLSENVIFYAAQNEHNKAIPYLGKRVGRQAVRSAFELRAQTTQLLDYELLEFIVEGNKACIISRTQEICKQTEQIFEIEDAQFIVLDEEGKISSWSFYFDPNPEVAAFTSDLNTRLIQAVQNNQLSIVQSLLAIGANVNVRDKNAQGHLTPLMIAARQANAKMVRLLLDSGADLYMLDSYSGDSVLHQACKSGSTEVIHLLIEAGAFVNAVSPTGTDETLLRHAHLACAEVLVHTGADLNLIDGIGLKTQE